MITSELTTVDPKEPTDVSSGFGLSKNPPPTSIGGFYGGSFESNNGSGSNNNFSIGNSIGNTVGSNSIYSLGDDNYGERINFSIGNYLIPELNNDLWGWGISYYGEGGPLDFYLWGEENPVGPSLGVLIPLSNSLRQVANEFSRYVSEILESMTNESNRQQIGIEREEFAKQLAERMRKIREVLETFNPMSEISKYLTLNDALARISVEDPETYGKIVVSINELTRHIVENDELRQVIMEELNEEERKLLLMIAYSTVRDRDDYDNVNQAAELLGFQPSQIFEDVVYIQVDKQNLHEESKENNPTEPTQRYLDKITRSEQIGEAVEALIDEKLDMQMVMSNPYLAHMLNAIAARLIATGKLPFPPDGLSLGEYLISALSENQELREEFKKIEESKELQSALGIEIKNIDQILKERKEIVIRIMNKNPDSDARLLALLFELSRKQL
ncbi:MAG: hypothetical protein N3C61_01620 [Candidatus Micrarchaeota archaeon]|nr:hypothetical protein [Candidatus Micrarchaeota archaeon]